MPIGDYELHKEIGKGAFSVVFLVTEKKTKKQWAMKIIDKKSSSKAALETEIEIMKKVDHPNIVKMHEYFESTDKIYLVVELVTGGPLFDRIVDKKSFTEKEAKLITQQLLQSLVYLHSIGIVHRDLKPENLLLKTPTDLTVALSDFGLSKIVGDDVFMKTTCGTPSYVAPEVLNNISNSPTAYSDAVDMWGVGVITYILLCGFPPFYSEDIRKLFESILSASYDFPNDYWGNVSKEAKHFINCLLTVEPTKRYSAKQALEHPWIIENNQTQPLPHWNDQIKKYMVIRRKESQKFGAELVWKPQAQTTNVKPTK
ncbi:hypothetical protein ACTFIW_006903 [Dictyostelium discoideum]|uniref:Probable myosin light chain kinase DDB_G0292624 n=1 Tax=Dictyostelium discoideum TaxID=44689 RepID=MYLKD_DICDI|nr:hypothetical protein DDB_G0292624 [Dictyostelium discoideum AX4]Q54CY9.1 RecName: Full=Probable myosin light chain kinase DDB_G0292624 [Dictyostelium discoideum]EAL61115.1 hypothetical protein DDB_G0292624 [Dictyostelium discoideum AX4]|eukprot:XP_629531.1 hypothetical protein DDB_G0292624 [Dictyostelium discoideum AX4]